MEFNDVIAQRRTTRQFLNKPVEKEKNERIVAAGLRAPSFDHKRKWDFIVVADADPGAEYPTQIYPELNKCIHWEKW